MDLSKCQDSEYNINHKKLKKQTNKQTKLNRNSLHLVLTELQSLAKLLARN